MNLSHETFCRLTPLHPDRTSAGKYAWLCQCDCGNIVTVRTADLMNGHTQSCGCSKSDKSKTHGLSKSSPYHAWRKMVARCSDDSDKDYRNYGARGITVCKEWRSYSEFHKWALKNGYEKGLTIDRIDNDYGYCPSNCRFVTLQKQERNKRNNIHVVVNGVKMLLVEFCEIYHIPYETAYWRHRNERNLLTGRKIV